MCPVTADYCCHSLSAGGRSVVAVGSPCSRRGRRTLSEARCTGDLSPYLWRESNRLLVEEEGEKEKINCDVKFLSPVD